MPQPGEIRHGQSGSYQWDGAGWNPVDVPNPMAGDSAAAHAETDATRKGDYFMSLLRGAGNALDPRNIPAAIQNLPTTARNFVEAGKEAVSHPSEILPAFENADPGDVGGALGGLFGLGVGGRIGGAAKAALPDVSAADAVRTAGKLGNFDITKPAGFIKPIANAVADRLEAPGAPEGFDRFMPNRSNPLNRTAIPRGSTPLSGGQVPASSVDEVLAHQGGRFADRQAGFSPEMVEKLNRVKAAAKSMEPSLYDLATADKGPTPAGTPWDAGNGEIIGYTTDTGGSTGLEPIDPAAELARRLGTPSDSEVGLRTAIRNDTGNWPRATDPMMAEVPEFTFEGQNLNGHPPAVGGTEIPATRDYEFSPQEPRSALNDINEEAAQRLAAQSGDVFKRRQVEGAFDGDRTVNPSWSDSPAAQLMRERAARGVR